ncbi:Eco57I restriction-modification methylase domain-containing protein [Mesobacillus harenae]|uniref:Eco57I restriction-modification methylase domain-containing protein n=1 Tax=Mesobacillus harenae TaxID=2213203 RepID=UPI0015808C7B|nr:N-6 DNA methylase [Mesobacillus harenae]
MAYDLKTLVDNFHANLSEYKSSSSRYNEHSTRIEYIDPLLVLLGWDVTNQNGLKPNLREVIPENYAKKGDRPDYTFTVSGVKKFFLEAKKPAVDITTNKSAALQARRYGFSAKHYITVLTNFEYLLIYDTSVIPMENDEPHVALLGKYHYTEYQAKWDDIHSIISRASIFSGKFEANFKDLINHRVVKTVDDYFLEQINDWRLKLANYLFYQDNEEYSIEQVNDITQTFINQMIFLRICEDRNLPLYHNLKETLKDHEVIKEEVFKVLEQADKKYNSGLFENNSIVMNLDNNIVMEMIEGLYYPKSPYIFNVIESNVLGEIYELFLSQKLKIVDGEITLVKVKQIKKEKKGRAENRDVVSTPTEIVRFIVKKALTPLVEDKKPEELLELKIADIACGSGVFLVEVYDFLINYIKNWYLDNQRNFLIEGENDSHYLPFDLKRRVLESCIFGLDIDANAVDVAQFSLLLKLLEGETIPTLDGKNKVLPDLSRNILQGNALVDSNHFQGGLPPREERLMISPFNWETNGFGEFDAIVGNPPYVKTDDMRAFLTGTEFKIYKKQYTTSYKQFDKYYMFIERGLSKLKDQGILSFIVQNKFSKIDAGEKLRELISSYAVKEFIDFGSTQLFRDRKVIAYSSIITIKKEPAAESFIFEEVNDLNEWWTNQVDDPDSLKRMTLDSKLLTKDLWLLVANPKEWDLISILYRDSILLGDENFFHTFNGVQTSAEQPAVYSFSKKDIIKEDSSYFYINRDGHTFPIEKAIVKPYFKPRRSKDNNIKSYDIVQPFMWIIFPYDESGKIYSPTVMKKDFSETWKYLNHYYNRLLPKQLSPNKKGRDVPHATKDTWYHYGRNQAFKDFKNNPKIIIGVNTHRRNPLNLLDYNDMVIASGGTAGYCAVSIADGSDYHLEYVHAILNHPAIVWLCSVMGSDFEGDFYSRGTYALNKLPIKHINFTNKEHMEYYHKVIRYSQEVYDLNEELAKTGLSKKDKVTLERDKEELIKNIQDMITDFYGMDHLKSIFEN